MLTSDRNQPYVDRNGASIITNVSNVPFTNPSYTQINSIGRQWIFEYTLALCREILGYVRGKYSTVPIPGSEVTLNQQDLLTDARSTKEALLTQLRDMLEKTGRQAQLEKLATNSENLNKTLNQSFSTSTINEGKKRPNFESQKRQGKRTSNPKRRGKGKPLSKGFE